MPNRFVIEPKQTKDPMREDEREFACSGEIDLISVVTLEKALAQYDEIPMVILDFANVTFIDSSGIRTLLEADRRRKARNPTHQLIIENMSDQGINLLGIAQVGGLIIRPRAEN